MAGPHERTLDIYYKLWFDRCGLRREERTRHTMTKPALVLIAACCLLSAQNKPVATAARALPPVEAEATPAEAKAKSRFSLHGQLAQRSQPGRRRPHFEPYRLWLVVFVQRDAAVPAFAVTESAKSKGTKDLCSTELIKDGTRGQRSIEREDQVRHGETHSHSQTGGGGGKSEIGSAPVQGTHRTFISMSGRSLLPDVSPPQQAVYYGSAYQTRLQYTGTQKMRSGDEFVDADRLTATIKSSSKEMTVDLFFARDAARTPLLVQIPVAVGKFSVEFVR